MPGKSERPLHLVPERSRHYAVAITVAHAAALAAAVCNGFAPALKVCFAAAVLASAWRTLRREVFFPPGAGPRLRYSGSSGWVLGGGSMEEIQVQLLPSTVVTRLLCVLHFRSEDGVFRAVVLFRDALDADLFRRLRVILKSLPKEPP